MSEEEPNEIIFSDKVEIFEPPNVLKQKAGSGGIAEHFIEKAEGFIRNNDIDFIPFAEEHIEKIESAFESLIISTTPGKQKTFLDEIVENIMLIKAHGGMFKYGVMSRISGVTLSFLEDAEVINDDMFQIIAAHNNTIKLIIKHDIKGDGGAHGSALLDELRKAIGRHAKKYERKD